MNILSTYRNPRIGRELLDEIRRTVTQPWVIMEICGGQTHALLRNGIDNLLPKALELVHGPGCPVCVTPIEVIDKAIELASRPEVILSTFGDMLRVPGSEKDLLTVKSEGGDVRMVYSPLDALALARNHPDRQVVFFAVGFETTAPNSALTVAQACREDLRNFSMLVSHVLVPPAMRALLRASSNRVQAYLAAGHVCTVMGWAPYEEIAQEFHVPIVVTGFESVDLLRGILSAVRQLEDGDANVENAYERIVQRDGNKQAQEQINQVFEICDRRWRGIGMIPASGWRLKSALERFDAEKVFDFTRVLSTESAICISGMILQGVKKPPECPVFGTRCTPQTPLGATMVSSEGACAAYYSYYRTRESR